MIRNLKALGLAVVAVLMLGAVAASTASAAPVFHSEIEKTIITAEREAGTSPMTFGTKSSSLSVTCEHETFAGTQTGTTVASVTVHPVYQGCKAEPFGTATVDTHGCDLVLYAETTSHLKTTTGEETDAPFEIECTAGSVIKITTGPCTITIGSQGKLHGVTYTNEETGGGSKRAITVNVTLDKIKYTTSGFGCGLGGLPKEGADALLTAKRTAKGFVDTFFTKDPTTHTITATEGAQVGIWKE